MGEIWEGYRRDEGRDELSETPLNKGFLTEKGRDEGQDVTLQHTTGSGNFLDNYDNSI